MASFEEMDYKYCIICQSPKDNGQIVNKPQRSSYENLLIYLCKLNKINWDILNNNEVQLTHLSVDILIEKNAVWHRKCYANATHKCRSERQNNNKSPRGRKRKIQDNPVATVSTSSSSYTRSHSTPYDKKKCFFCQQVRSNETTSMIHTENAGKSLSSAVNKSQNLELMTRLNSAIKPEDGHANDIIYHLSCYSNHVTHVLRSPESKPDINITFQNECMLKTIKFIEEKVTVGEHVATDEAEQQYINFLGGIESDAKINHKPPYNRKWLISQVKSHISSINVKSHPNKNKPGYFILPDACVENLVKPENTLDITQQICKVAEVIREDTIDFIESREERNSVSVISNESDVNKTLFSLIKWIIIGNHEECATSKRTDIAKQCVLTICQNIMYNIKSTKQVKYTPKSDDSGFKLKRKYENPQVTGHSLSIHFDTRSKILIDIAKSEGSGIPYHRVIQIETAIANAVIENCKTFNGVYVPPFLQRGVFVFFSTDNINFAEDTMDGKEITNATVIAVYQVPSQTAERISPPLCIKDVDENTLSPYNTEIMPCIKPSKSKLLSVRGPKMLVNVDPIDDKYKNQLMVWILCSAHSRINGNSSIPSLSGYYSLISNKLPITSTGVLPIIPESSTEYSTLLTVINQTRKLKTLAVGDEHPVILSCDLAIYEKALQIIDVDTCLKSQVIPRIGGLHTTMAVLRGIGTSIQNSGLDDVWQEADVFGSETTRQILKCGHYKRCLRAHLYTYHALFELELEQFLNDNPQYADLLSDNSEAINNACRIRDMAEKTTLVKIANRAAIDSMESELIPAFYAWEEQRNSNAMFRSMTNYMHRVEKVVLFIVASRSGDLHLHLQAGEALNSIFFAFDRIKYKRLWPRYISDMYEIEKRHPNTWRELLYGNISVTESDIPHVSIDGDHGTEHAVKCLKGKEALTGISNDETCRLRYFLSSPELSKLVSAYKEQHDIERSTAKHHHDLYPSAITKEQNATRKIKDAIKVCGNPFEAEEEDTLWNLVTHAYVPQQYVSSILDADNHGQELYEEYVQSRLNGDDSIWEPVTKVNNHMYMSGKSSGNHHRTDISDLRDTGDLYARLLILSNSGRDIDIKHTVGTYEFTVTPRSLFSADGTVLRMTDKQKLLHSLEKLAQPRIEDVHMANARPNYKVAIIDVSQLIRNPQKIKKTAAVKTVLLLSDEFNRNITELLNGVDELILVMDTWPENSLKMRKGAGKSLKDPVRYKIKDNTKISHLTMDKLLSHEATKRDLATYLADKVLEYTANNEKTVIVSYSGKTKSNKSIAFNESNHDEADGQMIRQGILGKSRWHHNTELTIHSTDTDVVVIAVSMYPLLVPNTRILTASGLLHIKPLWQALGAEKANALIGLHALSGCDTTGRFNYVGKPTWFHHFCQAPNHIIEALIKLGCPDELTDAVISAIAEFVCMIYTPKSATTKYKKIDELRYNLYCSKTVESDRLPPTMGALKPCIQRAHIQASKWGQSNIDMQVKLDPCENGYYKSDGCYLQIRSELPPAPESLIEMTICKCQKSQCRTQRCSCKASKLPCTDLCQCVEQCENNEDNYPGVAGD